MSPGVVRVVATILLVVLTASCGSSLEERRADDSITGALGSSASRVVFVPAKPRSEPNPRISDAELAAAVQESLTDLRLQDLRPEWQRIVSDARFRSSRAERPKRQYRLMLASWSSRDNELWNITTGYQQWCSFKDRRSHCLAIPTGRPLNESEAYQVAFDFAMGARWDGFIKEMKGMIQPETIRLVILTGLVVFMACLALPELTSKIPVAIATTVLTAYLGAQAVCNLVFGWLAMVREVERATTFEQVLAAGERYGRLIGEETARILVMVAMTAISEGGVIARLMKLPQVGAASAALATDTGGIGLESVTQVSGAQVLQGGVSITVEEVAQGVVGVAMAVRGGAPKVQTTLPPKPPQRPVDIKLKYKEEWTAEQRAAARDKVAKLNEAKDKVVVKGTSNVREARTSAAERLRNAGKAVPPGCEGDHCVDLQLNGKDTLSNLWPLDSSVNRSLGAQIHQAIKDLPAGTPIGRITIE